jgi:phosphotransferase system enzyme I (PtsI)
MTLRGLGASPGRAVGQVVRLEPVKRSASADPETALREVAEQLQELAARTEPPARDMLEAQATIALDPELLEAVRAEHAAGAEGPDAIRRAAEPFREALGAAESSYMRERVGDLDEICRRGVALMDGAGELERVPALPGVLVAASISPAHTAAVPDGELLAIVSGEGGDLSHTAILARSLGIPAVLGLGTAISRLRGVEWVAVDGDAGTVEPLEQPPNGDAARVSPAPRATPRSSGPATTADGVPVQLLANVASAAEAAAAARLGAQGAGLVRTEFLFAARSTPPGVDDQRRAYDELLDPLEGPAIVRVIDAGSDKPLRYVAHEPAPNPALGERGLRLLLRHPELLVDQVRALCQSRHAASIRVMLPMVSRAGELERARELLEPVFEAEGRRLPLGAMIEVPAAAVDAPALAVLADFLSLGTNDLLQYLFAVDRASPLTRAVIDPLPASSWRLLGSVFDAARAAGIEAGACGELAADAEGAGLLWALGASSLSVSPGRLEAVKEALRARSAEEWAALARTVTRGDSSG